MLKSWFLLITESSVSSLGMKDPSHPMTSNFQLDHSFSDYLSSLTVNNETKAPAFPVLLDKAGAREWVSTGYDRNWPCDLGQIKYTLWFSFLLTRWDLKFENLKPFSLYTGNWTQGYSTNCATSLALFSLANLPRLGLNLWSSCLCLSSSWDYWRMPSSPPLMWCPLNVNKGCIY